MDQPGVETWEGEAPAELWARSRQLSGSFALPNVRYRRLRIGFSTCGCVTAALVVILWVQSYSHSHSVVLPGIASCPEVGANSSSGQIYFFEPYGSNWWRRNRKEAIFDPGKGYRVPGYAGHFDGKGNPLHPGMGRREFRVPYWSAVLTLVAMSAVPWMRWRFSVRTLLIGSTLVAVLLGLVMWASRQ